MTIVNIHFHVLRPSKSSLISFIFKKSKPNSYCVASFSITPRFHNNISSKDPKYHKELVENLKDHEKIPLLPEAPTKKNDMKSGSTHYKLNDLGPVVVNEDRNISTIDNW